MGVYGIDFYGVGRFGVDPATVRPDFSVAPFTSTPLDYSTLHLIWTNPPSPDCIYLRLVRNPRNLPQDEDDGWQVFNVNPTTSAPPVVPEVPASVLGNAENYILTGQLRAFTDTDLPGGFSYYSMFGWSQSEAMWIRCSDLVAIVPINWGYSPRLYDLLPMAYRDQDILMVDPYNPWPIDSPSPPLQRYFQLIGFELDFIRTELESLMSINDPMNCSGLLLPVMAQQLGLVHEPMIGMQQERTLIANAVHLYKLKGSPRGITEFCSILTSYPSTELVHHGYNELLCVDDGVFADAIGTWQTWPPTPSAPPSTVPVRTMNSPALPVASYSIGVQLSQIPNLLNVPTTNPLEVWPSGLPGDMLPPYGGPTGNSPTGLQVYNYTAITGDSRNFEGGTTGNWIASSNTSFSITTAVSYAGGTHALQVQARAAGSISATLPSAAPIIAGDSYYCGVAFRTAATARSCTIAIQWLNASGGVISTTTSGAVTDASTGWIVASTAPTAAPAGAVNSNLVLTIAGAVANEIHYVDDVGFTAVNQDVYLTTGPVPITDFISQFGAIGDATFSLQFWSASAKSVYLSLWGDVGNGTAVQIAPETLFTSTAGHWTIMTVSGPVNPYPNSPPPGQAQPDPAPYGPASYYWIYPRVRIAQMAAGEADYITLVSLWPCTPNLIGVFTPAYDYPRDTKILMEPQATNLLTNTLTTFSRNNPSPPPNLLSIGFDGLTNTADPTAPTIINLVTGDSASFESGTTGGYAVHNCTISNSLLQAQAGTHSLAVRSSVVSSSLNRVYVTSPMIPVQNNNQTYTVSAWFYPATTVQQVSAYIVFYNASGVAQTPTTPPSTVAEATGTWTNYTTTQTPTAATTQMQVWLEVQYPGAIGEIHYVDNISITYTNATPTCTMSYRPVSIEDPPALVPINGNAALQINTQAPGATIWFGTVASWDPPPPSPNGWFASARPSGPTYPSGHPTGTTTDWFPGAVEGTLPRPWFDPINSWFFINQNFFGVGSAWVNGSWFALPPQPTVYGNLLPFTVNAGQPFNFSVFAQYMSIQNPSDAIIDLGFRWYYPDGTWTEDISPQNITSSYERYSFADIPPVEVNLNFLPDQMFPFVRFVAAQQDTFLLNSAMLSPGESLPDYMDATSQSSTSGDFISDPNNNASFVYPNLTPRLARLNEQLYRWIPMGSTYTVSFASGAVVPPLDPTLWP